MELPRARCVHCIPGRLRLRLEARPLSGEYAKRLEQGLRKRFPETRVEVNPATGSVLCLDRSCDPQSLAAAAKEEGLFALVDAPGRVPLAGAIQASFQGASSRIRQATRGELDIPSLVFLFLLGSAAYQISRGNLGLPPWYTAFWYAFGVFSKSLIDSESGPEAEAADAE